MRELQIQEINFISGAIMTEARWKAATDILIVASIGAFIGIAYGVVTAQEGRLMSLQQARQIYSLVFGTLGTLCGMTFGMEYTLSNLLDQYDEINSHANP